MNAVVKTTCPYCGVGCGVRARIPSAPARIEISGDPEHPANLGRLCSKGAALGETLGLDGRLLHPMIRGQRAGWEAALDHVAGGFARIIAEHGPQAVALYVSGQLLTEDYYVANKLMKGFIGAANIDTNSRLCMSSAVAGHKRAFGEDLVPLSYQDFDLADLVVLVGSNAAWCHPVLFQRLLQAKQDRPALKIVVIDPRRTATCEFADVHLPIRGGSDVALFNGLLRFLYERQFVANEFVENCTTGFAQALRTAQLCGDDAAVAESCGVDQQQLTAFYELFAGTPRVITMFSQGVNQSSCGTDKVNSIINCHLLTGRIGQPGMGPFSVTGQPNAMGGREVGGLANMLAAHMELGNADHRRIVQQFWGSPRIADRPGLNAVDLFDAIHDGTVKAVWIMATNPVVSMPDADKVRAALTRCELVVVSDCVENTDTNRCAHVLLPAAAWGEKEGSVTNSDRHISRQRAFLPLPGEARPDWWIICQVAKRLGHSQGFDFASAHEVFSEHAALSGVENDGARAFDIGALAGLSKTAYDELAPVQWPVPSSKGTGISGTGEGAGLSSTGDGAGISSKSAARMFGDGRFYHPDRKARFIPTAARAAMHATDDEFPLVLNTGRLRDQWHTMTRTGTAPRLTSHSPEPFIDMNSRDAATSGVRAGELATVTTRWGSMIARVRQSGDVSPGTIFVPIHWSRAYASDGRVGALVNPVVDPISGEPELKHTPARVATFAASWYGFILSRSELAPSNLEWWVLGRGSQFTRYEIAGRSTPQDWSSWARDLLKASQPQDDWIEYTDLGAGIFRAALLVENRIQACVFVSRRTDLPPRNWLASLFAKQRIADKERASLLLGEALTAAFDTGPTVCSCFGVGSRTLADAIATHCLKTVQQVGQKLRAGTNCGSCVAEIKMLLSAAPSENQ